MTVTTNPATTEPTTRSTSAVRRTAHLTRWNVVLLGRNRLALLYGTLLPLSPLFFLLSGTRGAVSTGASAIGTVILLAGLFPVYYNVLSQFVNRRDELVLKRIRTGEVRDSELMFGLALPGAVTALAVLALAVPIAAIAGQPLPLNALVYAFGAVLTVIMFAAFAFWTAAWTRSAEAAQLTSMPIIILASLGPVGVALTSLSDTVRDLVAYTPGAAMTELVRVGWFGLDGTTATESTLSFADTWSAAAQPMLTMVVWTVLALFVASRSMRWEPRA